MPAKRPSRPASIFPMISIWRLNQAGLARQAWRWNGRRSIMSNLTLRSIRNSARKSRSSGNAISTVCPVRHGEKRPLVHRAVRAPQGVSRGRPRPTGVGGVSRVFRRFFAIVVFFRLLAIFFRLLKIVFFTFVQFFLRHTSLSFVYGIGISGLGGWGLVCIR